MSSSAPLKHATRLRVLLVEDQEDDALLILRELQSGGFDVLFQRVDSEETMRAALTLEPWDLVISDHSMPGFDVFGALSVLHASGFDLPFIVVSGALDEERAVTALKAGAADFIVKGRLARLVPAVSRELRESSDRLERRRAEIAAEDSRAQKLRADAANEAKSKVLASVTHELRTPLNAILGFTELLATQAQERLSPAQNGYLAQVQTSARHLLHLVNDLLDLSKIDAGCMELLPVPTSFAQIATEALDLMQPLLLQRNLHFEKSVPNDLPTLLVDPTRLRQILFNLLSNAIKFTPRGGSVGLDAVVANQKLCFSVHDTGVGVPPEDLPKLFQDFQQLDTSLGGKYEGTGLGLSITKRLVELHGGAITVSARSGGGTTFRVELPVEIAPTLAPVLPNVRPVSMHTRDPERKCSVVVVEDDPPSARLFQAVLEARGYAVVNAATIDEAIAEIRGTRPDLVITDMNVPGGGGLRLLSTLRSDPALEDLYVIATTASGAPAEKERLLAAGFDAYAGKPLDMPRLDALIDFALARPS